MSDETMMEARTIRDKQQALDECLRELNVRRRCFARWVTEGRLSRSDAQDRLDRLATAIQLINTVGEPSVHQINVE